MKIPLQFVNGQILLSGLISAPSYRIRLQRIVFIVDTGSPKTFLTEKDALTFQIPFKALSFKEFMKLGGSKYKLLGGKKADFYFKTDEQKSVKFDFSLAVAQTTKKTEEGLRESRTCSSILGTDFLTQNSLGLVFKPSKGVYYLENDT